MSTNELVVSLVLLAAALGQVTSNPAATHGQPVCAPPAAQCPLFKRSVCVWSESGKAVWACRGLFQFDSIPKPKPTPQHTNRGADDDVSYEDVLLATVQVPIPQKATGKVEAKVGALAEGSLAQPEELDLLGTIDVPMPQKGTGSVEASGGTHQRPKGNVGLSVDGNHHVPQANVGLSVDGNSRHPPANVGLSVDGNLHPTQANFQQSLEGNHHPAQTNFGLTVDGTSRLPQANVGQSVDRNHNPAYANFGQSLEGNLHPEKDNFGLSADGKHYQPQANFGYSVDGKQQPLEANTGSSEDGYLSSGASSALLPNPVNPISSTGINQPMHHVPSNLGTARFGSTIAPPYKYTQNDKPSYFPSFNGFPSSSYPSKGKRKDPLARAGRGIGSSKAGTKVVQQVDAQEPNPSEANPVQSGVPGEGQTAKTTQVGSEENVGSDGIQQPLATPLAANLIKPGGRASQPARTVQAGTNGFHQPLNTPHLKAAGSNLMKYSGRGWQPMAGAPQSGETFNPGLDWLTGGLLLGTYGHVMSGEHYSPYYRLHFPNYGTYLPLPMELLFVPKALIKSGRYRKNPTWGRSHG